MNIIGSILLTVAVLNFTLSGILLWGSRRSTSTNWFATFSISLGLWALAIMGFDSINDPKLALLLLKISYSIATCIAASFFIFVHQFPEPRPFSNFQKKILILSTLSMVVLPLLPNFTVIGVDGSTGARMGIQELWGYTLFASYFTIYFFGALSMLHRRLVKKSWCEIWAM